MIDDDMLNVKNSIDQKLSCYMATISIINCLPSLPASILKSHIKIKYLTKSHMYWKFFVQMLLS